VSCKIVEADLGASDCDSSEARVDVDGALANSVRKHLQLTNTCENVDTDCQLFHLCEIEQLEAGTAEQDSCLTQDNPIGDGWCYVDPAQGVGDEGVVEGCPSTMKRKIRFAGAAAPKKGTVTFLACRE
jgi:hypothetical protein